MRTGEGKEGESRNEERGGQRHHVTFRPLCPHTSSPPVCRPIPGPRVGSVRSPYSTTLVNSGRPQVPFVKVSRGLTVKLRGKGRLFRTKDSERKLSCQWGRVTGNG